MALFAGVIALCACAPPPRASIRVASPGAQTPGFAGRIDGGPAPGPIDGLAKFEFQTADLVVLWLTDTTRRDIVTLQFRRDGPAFPAVGRYPVTVPDPRGSGAGRPAVGSFQAVLQLPLPTLFFAADTADGELVIEDADTLQISGFVSYKAWKHARRQVPADTVWVSARFLARYDSFPATMRSRPGAPEVHRRVPE